MNSTILEAQWPWLVVGLGLVVLLVSLFAVVVAAKDPRLPLAWLVGVTGGLQFAQIARVHVFCIFAALWLIFGVVWRRRVRWRVGWSLAIVAAAVLLASTALTGELVNSSLLGVQLMLLAGTAACLAAFGDGQDVRAALRGLLTVTSIACVAALLQYVGILPYRVFLGTDRPIGIYGEPDVLGTFAAIGLLLAYREGRRRMRAPLIFMHFIVLLLASARAAWVAVAVIAVVGYLAAKMRKEPKGALRLPGGAWTLVGGALVVIAVIAVSPSLQTSLQSRLLGNGSASDIDVGAQARQQQIASLLELESQAPWNGLGLSASGRVGVSGRIAYLGTSDNNVGTNWVLAWWVDGGVLSLPLIFVFLVAFIRRLSTTAGLVLGIVLVSSLFSNVLFFPISWMALGLCLADRDRVRQLAPETGASSDLRPALQPGIVG